MKRTISSFSLALAGLAIGLCIGVLLAGLAGENPLKVLAVIYKSAFGSRYDLGVTLYYATPLIFTGLSVAMAFHSGLFNIGAEGQLNLAALAVAVLGSTLHLPFVPAMIASFLVAALVGGLWAWIPGWLKNQERKSRGNQYDYDEFCVGGFDQLVSDKIFSESWCAKPRDHTHI